MTPHENLVKARELVAQGWTQDEYIKDEGDKRFYCALGAIVGAAFPNVEPTDVESNDRFTTFPVKEAVEALENALPDGETDVPMWNDDEDTSQKDVLAAFDKAIAATA